MESVLEPSEIINKIESEFVNRHTILSSPSKLPKNSTYYIILSIILFIILLTRKIFCPLYSKLNNQIINYNVQTKLLCHYKDYQYLCEWINTSFKDIELIIYYNDNEIFNDKNTYYISLRNMPLLPNSKNKLIFNEELVSQLPIHGRITPIINTYFKVGFINVEHLSDKYNLEYNRQYLLPEIDVYDYSLDNIKIFGYGNYISYKINLTENNFLKSCINNTKLYDISFVGAPSDRRINIINQLITLGYRVDIITQFGKGRDIRIGQSKLLLNIHLEGEWLIYEAIRCERWRFAGMLILSETCLSSPPDGIIECPYDKLVDKVIELIPIKISTELSRFDIIDSK